MLMHYETSSSNKCFYMYSVPLLIHSYLTWLEVHLTNLENTHTGGKDLLTKGAIAVAHSMIPGALSAIDKTMEETFMCFAKSSGSLHH